ncbi:hypothetical protein ABW21_db0204689 [Orbilia brochopaga]|nr:hypothetical protein ABW21_db0204689 [Drechslerella brochopaga]
MAAVILWLASIILAAAPASAYQILFLREERPDHFRAASYIDVNNALRNKIPGDCYDLDESADLGDVEIAVVYNSPRFASTTTTGLAIYDSELCGERYQSTTLKPAFIITLDPDNLYGIHLVRLRDLGIRITGGSYKGISVPQEEKSGGLLEGVSDVGTPINSVYVWDGELTDIHALQQPVYLGDVVERVPETTDLLERLGDSPQGSVYLSDLVERYLLPPDAAPIADTVTPWMQRLVDGVSVDIDDELRGPLYEPPGASGQNLGENEVANAEYPPLPLQSRPQYPGWRPYQPDRRFLDGFEVPLLNPGRQYALGNWGQMQEEDLTEQESVQGDQMNIEADQETYFSYSPNVNNLYSTSNLPSPQQNNLILPMIPDQRGLDMQDVDLGTRILAGDPRNEDLDSAPWGATSTRRRPANLRVPGLQEQEEGPITSARRQPHELDVYLAQDENPSGSQESGFTDLSRMFPNDNQPGNS